jgi:hypothetical protein
MRKILYMELKSRRDYLTGKLQLNNDLHKNMSSVDRLLNVKTRHDFLKNNYVEISDENDLMKIIKLSDYFYVPVSIVFFDSHNQNHLNTIQKHYKNGLLRECGHILLSVDINIYKDIKYKFVDYSMKYQTFNFPCFISFSKLNFFFEMATINTFEHASRENFRIPEFNGSITLLNIALNNYYSMQQYKNQNPEYVEIKQPKTSNNYNISDLINKFRSYDKV